MAGKLDGRVALVTGASSGIGEATALALAAEGAKVAIAARRSERLDNLAQRIKQQGSEALPITGNVENENEAENMVKKTKETYGRLDILVNDAGVAFSGSIEQGNPDEWRKIINTNLLGLMYTTHAAILVMKQQGNGHIVNVSSVAGRKAYAGMSVYSASKWGVEAFSEALREEVHKEHIRVTVVEPGLVATEIIQQADQQTKQRFESVKPLESKDIADAIIYATTRPEYVDVSQIMILPIDEDDA